MASSITVLNFDNSQFTRSLTARAIGVNSSDTIRWVYPSNATAQTTSFTPYSSNSSALVSQIGTLIFSFSATTYDYTTTGYSLCTLQLSCTNNNTGLTATSGIIYDTFPNIDLTLFINYERTNSSAYFYRLTSTEPYNASPNLAPYFVNLVSTAYNLNSSLSADFYNVWYSLNNSTNRSTNLTSLTGFERTPTTRLSSVQAVLSATTAPGSLSSFWTPHVLRRSLSAVFVPYFLSGDFIGYPKGYFITRTLFDTFKPNQNLQNSPGLSFYGEGHTETINLTSINVDSRATRYIWRLDNSTTKYPISSTIISQPLLSVYTTLTSEIGTYPTIPVSLHLTNSLFLSTDPFFYYDDITGVPTFYPYYISTQDVNGKEISPRNRLKESIKILPYTEIEYSFTPGAPTKLYLPTNRSQVDFTAILQTSVVDQASGSVIDSNSLLPCYGLYGIIWNWESFIGCGVTPQSFVGRPSSWETTSLTATFPKRWEPQPVLSAELFLINPIACSAVNLTWTLSTFQTKHIEPAIPKRINEFNYSFALKDNGGESYTGANGGKGITLSEFTNTNILLSAQHTVQSLISANFTQAAVAQGYSNDWDPKRVDFNIKYDIVSIPNNGTALYTPNKFVLTGTEIKFENLLSFADQVTSVLIDLDDNKTVQLTGENITNNFTAVYENAGFKTLRIQLYSPNRIMYEPLIFPNIIRVLNEYDQVSPSEYRSNVTSLQIPWPDKPQVGSNDWAVADNINNWFKKFFENLEYLETRGRIYDNTATEYFGYLGPASTSVSELTSGEVWTWEDLNCFSPTLNNAVITWRDVLSAENFGDINGRYVDKEAATWQNYECTYGQVSPTCYGLYDVEWSWRLRKKGSSLTPITWKQTQCKLSNGEFPKKWVYEPPVGQPVLVCSPGQWYVNVPQLNTYDELIAPSRVENRCIYYGIASRNNVLYTAHKNQIRLLNSNRDATFFDYEDTIDEVKDFSSIKNICLDSSGKIYILDDFQSQVTVYNYEQGTLGRNFKLFTIWGGFGSAKSNSKFSNPNDLHIDQLDNVWVTDTGNGCVKMFSNTGYWVQTIIDDSLKQEIPLSTAVDSQKNVHILTKQSIRVYNYKGEFLFSYSYKNETTREPRKINSSYNREIIYLATDTQVLKYFRNGVFFSYIIKDRTDVNNINGLYHDEFRNLLILSNDKILKYPDVMVIKYLKGFLPDNYWKLEDVLIHKEEYIQNWVYTKAFQRMWDNIEIFRSTLFYNDTNCKSYKPPVYSKDKMIIGQNEIVTSTVINRVLEYLWVNLTSLFDYFDPSCDEPI